MHLRLLVTWVLNALALFGIAYLAQQLPFLEGYHLAGFEAAAVAVAILAVLNMTVRPILKILTLPITCLTFGIFALVINALMMMLTDRLVVGFEVGGFLNAVILSILYAVASGILNGIFNPKEDDK